MNENRQSPLWALRSMVAMTVFAVLSSEHDAAHSSQILQAPRKYKDSGRY